MGFSNRNTALFNDLKIHAGLFWGMVIIDTAKELVHVSNLDKGSLDEIETYVNRIMLIILGTSES